MINTLFFLISTMLLAVFNISNIAVKGNVAKRAFIDMPVTLVKNSVVVYQDESNTITNFYFNEKKLMNSIYFYFHFYLPFEPSLAFTFFNYDEHGQVTLLTNDKPENVQIHFVYNYYQNYYVDEYLVFKASLI